MFVTQGGRFGGYGFYVLKSKPVFLWNLVDLKRISWENPALSPGKHTVEFDFKYNGPGAGTLAFGDYNGLGKGGTGVPKVGGNEVANHKVPATTPFIFQWDETFDVGSDTGTPVDDRDYHCPFAFTGKLEKLTVKLGPSQMFPAEEKIAREKVGQRD